LADATNLSVTANPRVELSVLRALGEINAELLKSALGVFLLRWGVHRVFSLFDPAERTPANHLGGTANALAVAERLDFTGGARGKDAATGLSEQGVG
jgi:hypothetical protein